MQRIAALEVRLDLGPAPPHRLEFLARKEPKLVGAMRRAGAGRIAIGDERAGLDGQRELDHRLVRVAADGTVATIAGGLIVDDAEHAVATARAVARQIE